MPTRFLIALLLLTLSACIEGSPPVSVGVPQRGPDATASTVEVVPDTGIAADGQSTAQVRVTVKDRTGKALAGQEVAFTATGADNLLVQPPLTDANGQAMGTIASTRAETKTLTVEAGPAGKRVTLAQQPQVTFVAANVARIVFLDQPPASARAGQVFAPPVRVRLLDAQGNAVTARVNVTIALVAGNGAPLQGTAMRLTTEGVATFDDLNVQRAGTGYTLRASVGPVAATSNAFDIVADTLSPLATSVEVSKTPVMANGADSTSLIVTVQDRFGNPVAGQAVGLAVSGSNNTLSASSGTTDANGVFTATLRSTRAEVKTVDATVNGTALAQRPTVTFIPGSGSALRFVTQPPASLLAGQTMAPAVSVEVLDAQGNRVAGFSGPVTMELVASNGATLGGTTPQPAAAGLASFNDLSVQRAGTGYQLRASVGALQVLSTPFDVAADTVSALVSTVEVSKTPVMADGTDSTSLIVAVQDRFGNPVAGQTVGLAVTGSNNTLSASSGTTDANGVFTATLRSTRAEVKTVDATVNGTALSQRPTVTFVAGPAASLRFVTQPPVSVTAGQTMAPAVNVEVLDAQGNRVTGFAGTVTMGLVASNGATLSGTPAQPVASGLASFNDLSVQRAGTGYQLRASVGALQVLSTSFDVAADTVSALVSTVEVSKTPVMADGTDSTTLIVTVQDRFSNPVAGQTVGLAVSGNSNTLSANSGTTDANGVFTATLRSTRAEVKTVDATVNGTAVAQRPTVTFIPGPAAALRFLTQPPASVTAGRTMAPAVNVEVIDAQGNRVTGFAGTVTMGLVASNGATLSGTPAQPVASGLASFNDLSVQRAGTGYQLRATTPGPSGALEVLSALFDVTADTQSALTSSLDASKNSVLADGNDSTTVTVTVQDRFSNPVPGQTVTVAATGANNILTPSSGTTGANGLFTATLRSTRAEVKTISAMVNGTAVAQSRNVTFIPGPPASLAFITQPPASLMAGSTMGSIQVELLDAAGNRVTNSTDTVELSLNDPSGGSASLGGTPSRSAAAGVATFNDLFVETAGQDYQLLALTSLPGVTPETSNPFDITPAAPSTTTSTLSVSPGTVVADNVREAVITVTVRDPYNNPVEAQAVSLSVSGVANTLDRSTGVSGVNGLFVARLRSSRAEVKTVSATVNALPLAATASSTFVAGEVANLGLIAVPSEVEADGVSAAVLTATAEDVFGNRVPGVNVVFTSSGSNNIFDPGNGPTDVNGERVTNLRSTSFGVRTVTATVVTGTGNRIGTTPVTFLRPAAQVSGVLLPVSPAAGCTTLQYTVSQPQSSPADMIIEYEEGGVFKRATQAGSDTGSGVQSVATSPTGVTHVFHWNSTADLPSSNATVRMRVTSRLVGSLPNSVILNGVTLANGLRFASPGLMPAGTSPTQVARADLNADGRMDLLVTTPASNAMQVLMGDGVGGFGAPTAVNVGVSVGSLLVRDLDNDGRADVLVGNVAGPEVMLIKGLANGAFAAPVTAVTLQGNSMGLSVGDFNRDGRLDLAATSAAGTVEVALATTAGTFAAPTRTNVGGTPRSIAVADFNLDARLDLVFADSDSDVKRMLGDGSGGFGAVASLGMGTGAVALAVSDLNVDARPDVVAARATLGVVSVAHSNGDGTFAVLPAVNTGGQPSGLAVADMDGDGRSDVVVSGVGSDALVLRGELNGALSNTPLVVAAGGPLSGLVVLDADRSGRPDVVAARTGDNGVAVMLNTMVDRCERTLAASMQLAVATLPSAVAVSDLDKDGRLDLVAAASGSNALHVTRGRGNGTFTAFTIVPLPTGATNPQGVAAGDFNNDGRVDLVSANQNSNNVSVLVDNGAGGYTGANWSTATSPRAVATADFDQDGKLDLVASNGSSNTVSVLYGNGDGTFPVTVTANVGVQPTSVVAADINSDGCPDVVTGNTSGGNVTSLRTNRNAATGACLRTFASLGNFSVGGGPRSLNVGDFNRDNKLDLAVANSGNNSVSVLPGVGDGSFLGAVNTTATGTSPEFRDPRGLAVGDFNQDGKLDLATGNFLGPSITLLLGQSTAGGPVVPFTIGPTVAAGTGLTSLTGADLDGDGRQDLVGTTTADNRVSVLRGTNSGVAGAALFTALPGATAAATALSVTTGDINKDGKPDLLVANRATTRVSLLMGDGMGGFGTASTSTVGTNPFSVTVADVNRDGNPDAVAANNVTNNLTVLLGDGTGLPLTGTTVTTIGSPKVVRTVDVDLDGDLDIVTAGSQVHVHVNNGSGTFNPTPNNYSVIASPLVLLTADFNNDGRVDVATGNNSTTITVSVVTGNGAGGFGTARTMGLGFNAVAIAAGDVDRDGKLDLAVAGGNAPNYEVRVLKGVGDGSFSSVPLATLTLSSTSPGLDGLAIGDIDGDGRLDLAATAPSTDNVVVWRGNGAGGFSTPVLWSSSDTSSSVTLEDLNSDGLLDIATGGSLALGVLLGR
ncbi:MAG TPA: FG-GAP-like repeat-containing protein [Myxococcaceae bacterium]